MKILRATLKEVVCSPIVSHNKVCYLIMLFNLFMWIADYLSRADKSAVIGITLRTSPSATVGARAVGSGWEGLDGRPRPVPWAPILEEHDPTPSDGRPSRPTQPHIHRPRPYG